MIDNATGGRVRPASGGRRGGSVGASGAPGAGAPEGRLPSRRAASKVPQGVGFLAMNLLERLRRRRGLVARLVAPLLCTVSLGMFGCPCVMAADLGQVAPHAAHAGAPGGPHGHDRHCPFCPPGAGQHGFPFCSGMHHAVDHAERVFAVAAGWSHDLLPAADVAETVPTPAPPALFPRLLYAGIHAPPPRLNLRYCVFLN